VSEIAIDKPEQPKNMPNWPHVGIFLGLTFGLTWLLDLIIYLHGGLNKPGTTNVIQLQMLLPAFSAIVLGMFFFPESPLCYRRPTGRGRWFYYYFLLLTAVYVLGALGIWLFPPQGTMMQIATITPEILAYLGLLVLIVLRFAAGREAMARVWLTWGNWRYWLLFAPAIVAFYVLQVILNAIFGLGPAHPSPIAAPPGLNQNTLMILVAVQSVLVAPILAIVLAFGEEYGWRGYLQSELLKWGRVRGVLLVGVIWGAWHWPLILMGFSYPGYPLLGMLLAVFFLIGFAVVLGTVVLRSGSVLLSAYLHALNDQTTAFIVFLGYKPFNPVFSFGVGIYGVATLAIITLLVLRDPVWRGGASNRAYPLSNTAKEN
jgi:membrane protease YdiL (CAAX protease family)